MKRLLSPPAFFLLFLRRCTNLKYFNLIRPFVSKINSLIVCFTLFGVLKAQVPSGGNRVDINTLSQQQQSDLANFMLQYIDYKVLTEHCDMRSITGGDIHSDFDFLRFHRAYIEGMEDYLIKMNRPQYVPLPYWDPTTILPTAFQQHATQACSLAVPNCPNVFLIDCANTTLTYQSAQSRPQYLTNWAGPNSDDDLCDWNMNPISPSTANCCPIGLSQIIEGDEVNFPPSITNPLLTSMQLRYHNLVHGDIGGYFSTMISPASPGFWLWHAYVDKIWRDWEVNCPQSNQANLDLYMKDHKNYVISERDLGNEPNIYNSEQYLSYEIWCRNADNGGIGDQTHQNPRSDGVNPTHVYVRVRNRGKFQNTGNEQLKLYWAKAATNLSWPAHWDGSITRFGQPMGGLIGTLSIPQIKPQGQEILHFTWMAPDPSNYSFN